MERNGTDLISTTVVVVMMRRESRDDSDAELVCRLFHFGRCVRVHRGGLIRGVVYDEIRIVVLPNGDRDDPHAGPRIDGGVQQPLLLCERRAQQPQSSPGRDAGLT